MKKTLTILIIAIISLPMALAKELTENNIEETLEEITAEDIDATPDHPLQYFFKVKVKEFFRYKFERNQTKKAYLSLVMLKKRTLEYEIMGNKTMKDKSRKLDAQVGRITRIQAKISNMPIKRDDIREKVQNILVENLERHEEVREEVKERLKVESAKGRSSALQHEMADDLE